jgi:hypothetical protein
VSSLPCVKYIIPEAVTAQLEHELDALGYDGNVEGVESLERIKAAVADVNANRRRAELSALAPLPVGVRHPSHEYVPERVVAHHEPSPGTVGHHVIAGGINDLPDTLHVWAVEPPNGDLYPVAHVELHYPIVAEPGDLSYAACGLCGQVWGCDCMANPPALDRRSDSD